MVADCPRRVQDTQALRTKRGWIRCDSRTQELFLDQPSLRTRRGRAQHLSVDLPAVEVIVVAAVVELTRRLDVVGEARVLRARVTVHVGGDVPRLLISEHAAGTE